MTNRAHVLLWTDQTAAYLDALKAAGLADRVAIETLPRKEKPSAEQLARTEALMAGGVPAGLLPSMPKLRWAQAMSAGSWRRWEAEEAALSSSSTVPYHNDPAKKQQPRTTGQQHPLPVKCAQNED